MTDRLPPELHLRHPTEGDQPAIVRIVDEWFGGRRVRSLVVRSWFRHFGSTSWLAEDAAGHPVGFLIGFRSQDDQAAAVIHLLAVDPNHRRRGIGRALVDAFVADVGEAGIRTISALAWPDDPIAIAFFRGVGFGPDDGPGSQNLYGTPAFADYDGDGEDRTVFTRRFSP